MITSILADMVNGGIDVINTLNGNYSIQKLMPKIRITGGINPGADSSGG